MKAVMPTNTLADDYGMDKAIDLIADAGFDGIDFSDCYESSFVNFDGYIETAKTIRDRAEKRGIQFYQAHAPFVRKLLKQGDWGFAVERTRRSMETAAVLGADTIVVHPFQDGNYVADANLLYEKNMEFFKKLIPYCEEYNIKVAIENMTWANSSGGKCDGVCAIPQEFERYIDDLNSKYITGCLDFGHLTVCNREPQDVLRYLGGKRITCLHIHDNDYISDRHALPCTMNMNWDEICKAIAEIGYNGHFTLEANCFFIRFNEDFLPIALKFAADMSHHLIKKIENYKSGVAKLTGGRI